jgi:hypothetical protein
VGQAIPGNTHRFITKVGPKELSLGGDTSGVVRVNLTVPTGTASGTGDDIVAVASSTAGSVTSNSSVVHVSVSASGAGQDPH